MKKLYTELFHIPKHEKISDKVILVRIAMIITIVISCLAAISFSAYAYFTCGITSTSNVITSAVFDADVTVRISDSDGNLVNITTIASDDKTRLAEGLEVGKYYTITITPSDKSTAKTGFVIITAEGCSDAYHTQQLATDVNSENGNTPSITFKLMITDNTTVQFQSHWGTSIYYDDYKNNGDNETLYITQDEEIKMIINGVVDPVVETENTETENTQADNNITENSESVETEVAE